MAFDFTCPFCLNRTRVPEEYLGQSGPCASCGRPVTMPTRDQFGGLVSALQTGKLTEHQAHKINSQNRPADDRGLLRALLGIASISLISFIAMGVIFGLPALRRQLSIAACNNDLARMTAIANALNAYCDQYGSYPPPQVLDKSGKPLLSWRVLILPFLGYKDLYGKFALDQSWDSPLNLSLMSQMPREFCSDNSPDAWGTKQPNFVLLTGRGTLFPPSGPMSYKQVSDTPTLLLVESQNGGLGWTEPDLFDIQSAGLSFAGTPLESLGGLHTKVALGVDTQGNPVFIPMSTSPSELQSLITPNAGDSNASKDYSVYP